MKDALTSRANVFTWVSERISLCVPHCVHVEGLDVIWGILNSFTLTMLPVITLLTKALTTVPALLCPVPIVFWWLEIKVKSFGVLSKFTDKFEHTGKINRTCRPVINECVIVFLILGCSKKTFALIAYYCMFVGTGYCMYTALLRRCRNIQGKVSAHHRGKSSL